VPALALLPPLGWAALPRLLCLLNVVRMACPLFEVLNVVDMACPACPLVEVLNVVNMACPAQGAFVRTLSNGLRKSRIRDCAVVGGLMRANIVIRMLFAMYRFVHGSAIVDEQFRIQLRSFSVVCMARRL